MSEPINDGGPAFPSVGEGFGNPSYSAPGLSLRDYFAAHEQLRDWDNPDAHMSLTLAETLAGCPSPSKPWGEDPIANFTFEAKWRAALRFIRADAMISIRNQQPPTKAN